MRAVIYARYSSDMQREESVEAQIRACKYYAQQNGIDIVGIYADRAKSGMYHSEKREQFNALLQAAPRKEFDVVLVHKLSRFGRAGVKALNDRDHLERLGIEIISVTERLENTPEGKLMLYVITGMNEYYSRNLATEVLKGMKENAYKGLTTGGVPALGYDLRDKRLVINEHEAVAVRLIFEMFLAGAGYGEIINELNTRGYRTKRGASFGKNSIYDILRNERYTGRFTYGKTKTVNGHRSQHSLKQKDYISVEGGCPAIVTVEDWERVQMIMDRRKKAPGEQKAKELYILAGKLFCGHCGAKMVGNSRVVRGERYLYYDCNAKLRQKTCTKHAVKKQDIEQAVISKLNSLAFSDEFVEELVHKMYEDQGIERPDTREQLAEIEKKMERLVIAIENGADIAPIKQRMKDLSAQKEALLSSQQTEIKIYTVEELRSRLKQFLNIADLPPAQQKYIIGEYVTRIEVFDNDGGGHKCRILLSNSSVVDTSVFGSSAPRKPARNQRFRAGSFLAITHFVTH